MSEMIKRVARAICSHRGFDPDAPLPSYPPSDKALWEDYVPDAVAVIEAMRCPPKEVLVPLYRIIDDPGVAAFDAWNAAIDEALRD